MSANSPKDPPNDTPNDTPRPIILTIDDDKGFRESLERYFEDLDYRVVTAENGAVGLQRFREHRPDLIMLDLRMPEMNGIQALSYISAESPETPVIVLSGAGVMGDVVEALRLGAWDYLFKPVQDVRMLEHAVNRALERALLIKAQKEYQNKLEAEVFRRTQQLERTASALRHSEKKYRLLTENLKDVVMEISPDGKLQNISSAIKEFGGYEPLEEIGNPISKYFVNKDEADYILRRLATISYKERLSPIEFSFKPKNEPPFPVEVTGKVLHEACKPVSLHCSMRDIGKRKRTENALKKSEQRFRDLSFSIADWIWEIDEHMTYVFAAGNVEQLMGYTPEQLEGKHFFDLLPPENAAAIKEKLERITANKEAIVDLEHWTVTKSGQQVCLLTNAVPLLDDQNRLTGYRGIHKNISRRKRDQLEKQRLQHQLQHSQKMEAIGTLSGGIAHDFNNLLTVINGHAEIGLIKLEGMDTTETVKKVEKDLDAILQAGKKAEKLTRQLLTFSRKQVFEPKVLNINQLMTRLDSMLLRLIGEDISVQTHLDEEVPAIKADPGQLEQIIINLAVNARDAINQNSERSSQKQITIETRPADLDTTFLLNHNGLNEGRHVLITVSDSGTGMDAETREKIFEPFFTTKPKGRGTGLGMATVYGIVKQNNADITVYSELNRGTTFKIYWPATDEQQIDSPEKKKQQDRLTGNETIFLVEDEDAVRQLASQ